MSERQIPDGLQHPMWRTPPEDDPAQNQPTLATEVAMLVQGYVDDKIAELRFEVQGWVEQSLDHIAEIQRQVKGLQLTVGGMRDGHEERFAAIEGQLNLPEHVYRNFIKSEAERLRIVKPVRKGTGSYGGEGGDE